MSLKKFKVLVVAIALAFGLVACAAPQGEIEAQEPDKETTKPAEEKPAEESPEPEAPEVQELVVVNSAFGQASYDPTSWWYVAIMENPNPAHVFSFAEIDVEAYGADGVLLDTGTDYVEILPGQFAVTGTFINVGSNVIDRIEVRGPTADAAAPAPKEGVGTFTVTDLVPVTDDYSTTVGGNLTATFAEEQELVNVVVVASNPAGAIIGAEMTYVERMPADGTPVRFEARFFDPLPADTVYTAYARL